MIAIVLAVLAIISIISLYLTMTRAYEYGTREYTINMVAGIGSDVIILIMLFMLS